MIELFAVCDKKLRAFKSKENIHKKEVGPYHGFAFQSFISNPIKEPEENTMNLQVCGLEFG